MGGLELGVDSVSRGGVSGEKLGGGYYSGNQKGS